METKDHFEVIFAKAYPDFTRKLVGKTRSLTYNEIRVCMYLRMGYSNKKICAQLGISAQTMSNLRSGLRKKMGIPRGQDLTAAILCI